jgi:hypothetical protein
MVVQYPGLTGDIRMRPLAWVLAVGRGDKMKGVIMRSELMNGSLRTSSSEDRAHGDRGIGIWQGRESFAEMKENSNSRTATVI